MERVARQFVPIRNDTMQVIEAELITRITIRGIHEAVSCIERPVSSKAFQDGATYRVGSTRKVVERERYNRADVP